MTNSPIDSNARYPTFYEILARRRQSHRRHISASLNNALSNQHEEDQEMQEVDFNESEDDDDYDKYLRTVVHQNRPNDHLNEYVPSSRTEDDDEEGSSSSFEDMLPNEQIQNHVTFANQRRATVVHSPSPRIENRRHTISPIIAIPRRPSYRQEWRMRRLLSHHHRRYNISDNQSSHHSPPESLVLPENDTSDEEVSVSEFDFLLDSEEIEQGAHSTNPEGYALSSPMFNNSDNDVHHLISDDDTSPQLLEIPLSDSSESESENEYLLQDNSYQSNEAMTMDVEVDVENSLENIDISYGRIRRTPTIRSRTEERQSNQIQAEWRLAQLEREVLRGEILLLRERQERTLRGLLSLRLEQFRLRHQQMLSLLQFIEQHGHSLANNSDSTADLRALFNSVSDDLLASVRTVSSVDENFSNLQLSDNISSAYSDNQFSQLLEMVSLRSMEDNSNCIASSAATDNQIKSLNTRKYSNSCASELEKICTICRSDFQHGEDQSSLVCGHWHCTNCLEQWLLVKNACPVCRTSISPEVAVSDCEDYNCY